MKTMGVTGVVFLQLHGRSREQRYTKSADWDYIATCSKLASPVPLFGMWTVKYVRDFELHIHSAEKGKVLDKVCKK